jgi:hypothetical protein
LIDVTLASFEPSPAAFVAVLKFFSKNPKVLTSPSVNGYRDGLAGLEKFFSTNPKVSEIYDVNQKRCASSESKQLPQPSVFTAISALFS